MTLQMVTCPLCCQPGFNTPDALCNALVDSSKRNLACPVCNEIVTGLDKLTIHLFAHNSSTDQTVTHNNTQHQQSSKTTTKDPSTRPTLQANPLLYFQSDNGQLFAVATSAILNQFGAVTFNTQNYYTNTNVANQSGSGTIVSNVQNYVNDKIDSKIEYNSCKELLTSGDFSVTHDEQDALESTNKSLDASEVRNDPSQNKIESKVASTSPFTCSSCDLEFSNYAILAVHKQLLHKNHDALVGTKDVRKNDKSIKKPLNCNWCSATFNLKSSLLIHIKVTHPAIKDNLEPQRKEQEKLGCQICGKSFQKEGALHQHMKLTHGEKPWLCTVCSKRFTTKYFLRKHKRIHTGETPYECTICHKVFTFQQSYHKHMLYHTDDKPYCCSHCGRLFKELSTLNNHERIHSGEKPFTCENCGKSFRQRVSYLVHRRIHTGAMPYKCTACDKSFRYKISQRTHKCPVQPPGVVVKTSVSLVDRLQAVIKQEEGILQCRNGNTSTSSSLPLVDAPQCKKNVPNRSGTMDNTLKIAAVEEYTKNCLISQTSESLLINGSNSGVKSAKFDGENPYSDESHSSDLNLNELLFGQESPRVDNSDPFYQNVDSSPSECLDRLHISSIDCSNQHFATTPQNLTFDTMEDLDLCSLLFDMS